MLHIELLEHTDIDRAAEIFHRDGFVAIKDALTPEQFAFAKAGADRVIKEQIDEVGLDNANRGFARFSFNSQTHNPEWSQLIDLPNMLAIVEKIWSSTGFSCTGAGGDYSVPGAKIQPLHADMADFFNDPWGQVTIRDIPAPFIVINFTMVDFTKENGAIRFIPCTQRSRHAIPTLEEEPEWMQNSIVCAPANTAIIRDVRCWHGGTANSSEQIRPMTSVGYFAPWFKPAWSGVLPRELYNTLSPRGQELARYIVAE